MFLEGDPMEKKSGLKRINDRLIIMAITVMICALCTLSIIRSASGKSVFSEPQHITVWYDEDGKVIHDKRFAVGAGETKTITCVLPATIGPEENLFLWNRIFVIDADINGKNIYTTEGSDGNLREFDIWDSWQRIFIPSSEAGKKLTLHITGMGTTQYFNCTNIYFGNLNEISIMAMEMSLPSIWIGFAITLIAFILLIYWVILAHYHITEYREAMLDLSVMSFLVALWIAMEEPITSLVFSHGAFRLLTSVFTLFLCMIPDIMFFSDTLPSRKNHLRIILLCYSILILIMSLVIVFNIAGMQKVFIGFVGLSCLIRILIAYNCLAENKRRKDKLNWYLLLADIVILFGTVSNAVLYFLNCYVDSTLPFRTAYIVMLVCIGLTLGRRSMRKFSDIRAAEQYKELAYVDKVTGGETRLKFSDNLKKRDRDLESWFINIDLINFKLVNQSYGWDMGNKMLMTMYNEINSLLEENEHVCSLGNASFGCLLYLNGHDDLTERIGLISLGMKKCARNIDRNLLVKIGFYVCRIARGEDGLDELLDRTIMANKNRYAEHIPDLNCYVYNEKCRQELLFDKDLENLLSGAVSDGEFIVYYQPKIELSSGRMVGAEALVRWNSAKYGMLMPGRFIPLFEQNGLIADVDLNVLKQVCGNISHWFSVGIDPPKISVNISKAVIYRDDVMKRYSEIIAESSIPRKYLEFELTESMAYNNYERIQKLIDSIHQEGSTCSMDDFGKQYSNLNALDTLNFDTVKMDMCFFDNGFPAEQKKVKMVEGTLKLLKGLNLEVVAEGIESSDQVVELKRLGCDMIQGFYYAKPMPIRDFELFMRASSDTEDFKDTAKGIHRMM